MTDYFFTAPSRRRLWTSKIVLHAPSTAFAALSDVSSYERATSLIYHSTVTSKDTHGLAQTAKLNVGYPPLGLVEDWPCQIKCDRSKRTVEISSAPYFQSSSVESFLMKWTISPVANEKSKAGIRLDMEVKFKGPIVDSMFAYLPDVAESTLERFEALVEALDKKDREIAKKKPVPVKKAAPAPAGKPKANPVEKALPATKTPVTKATPEPAIAPVKRAPKKLEVRSGQSAGGKKQSMT